MAKSKRTAADQQSHPNITWQGAYNLEQREAMIREVAYFKYVERGSTPGYDLDDWLAAETELEHRAPESQEIPPDTEVQQSSVHGAEKDDRLKEIIKQHPHKAIPQVESMEPEKAPFKE